MSSSDSSVRFVDDTRAVSAVIGFILIFGILILLLTTYQAAIVPQQNAQTEFEHFEDNRNEMIQLRNAISTAGQSDVSQFPSVKLGTNYQTRLLTINPAPPAGTLQTSESYNITISDGTNDPVEIPTRFLEYQPGYNEISVGSTWYENSVLYLDERGTSSTVIIEEQNLITDGEKLKLTALQNRFSQSGTSRTTLELYPTRSSEKELEELEGELIVEIPTRLTDSDHWEILNETLDENTAVRSNGVDENNEIDDGVFYLELEVDNQSVLELNTVGIREEPNEGPGKNFEPTGGGGSDDDSDDDSDDEGDELPEGAVAFSDENENGVYDEGEETYTENQVTDFDDDTIDLVIEQDIERNGGIKITANTVTVRSGVTVRSPQNDVEIDAQGGDLDLTGATIIADAPGGTRDIELDAENGDIILLDTTLSADGDIEATPADDGTLFVNNSGDSDGSGTIIEDRDGNAADLSLEAGTVNGVPEKGSVVDNT